MWSGIRRRAGQAWALAGLAALIAGCVVFAPLCVRGVEQGLLAARLAQESESGGGLTVSSGDGSVRLVPPTAPAPEDPTPAYLARQVPPAFRAVAGVGVGSTSITVTVGSDQVRVLARDQVCAHVRITAGRCPSARNEVAMTPADAALGHWVVGSRLVVAEATKDLAPQPIRKFFTVVGLYRQVPGAYWFGEQLTGFAGTRPGYGEAVQLDDWVTDPATMAGGRVDPAVPVLGLMSTPAGGTARSDMGWMNRTSTFQVPLRAGALTIDAMGRVAGQVDRALHPDPSKLATVSFASDLPAVIADVRRGQQQVRLIVPLLLGQLAVLALVVLWLLLRAAVGQRRPEVALAKLRGQGAGAVWLMLSVELGAVLLAGVLVGVAGAAVAQRTVLGFVLPAGVQVTFPATAWVAAAAAAAASLGCLAVAARHVAREPVTALLRGVPPHRSGWAVGVADAILVTGAAAALVTLLTNRGGSPLAIAATPLLALALALVLTHAVSLVAPAAGRRLLRRGQARAALLTLRLSRRSSLRQLTAIVCVTAALVVFAADVYSVAARNRHAAAVLQVGAPLVASVDVTDIPGTQAALAATDPQGRTFTEVYRVAPSGGGSTVLMVDPQRFRRIATLPAAAAAEPAWNSLATQLTSPLLVRGRSLGVRVSANGAQSVYLGLTLADSQDLIRTVDLGEVKDGAHDHNAAVPCASGCRVMALTVTPRIRTNTTTSADFTLSGLRVGASRAAASLGSALQWAVPVSRQPGDAISLTGGANGATVAISATNLSGGTQQLTHRDVADVAPALVGGGLPAGAGGDLPPGHPADVFTASGVDGVERPYRQVGSLPDVPGGAASTVISDLNVLQRDGRTLTALPGQVEVWSARDDAASLTRLRAALGRRGLRVSAVQRIGTVETDLGRSASGWGLQIGLLAALAALAVAVLGITVETSTTWRAHTREDAALRLAGMSSTALARLGVLEKVTVLVVAAVIGATCGVLGAHLTLPSVPLFTTAPAVLVPDLSTSWAGVLAALAAVLLVITFIGVTTARWVARRAALTRLQDNA